VSRAILSTAAVRWIALLLLWSLTSALLRCLSLAAPFLLLLAIVSLLAHN